MVAGASDRCGQPWVCQRPLRHCSQTTPLLPTLFSPVQGGEAERPVQTGSLPSVLPERHIEPVALEAVEAWVALREWLQPTNLPRTKCICGAAGPEGDSAGALAGGEAGVVVADLEVDERDVRAALVLDPVGVRCGGAGSAVGAAGDLDVARVEAQLDRVDGVADGAAVALDVEDQVDRVRVAVADAAVDQVDGTVLAGGARVVDDDLDRQRPVAGERPVALPLAFVTVSVVPGTQPEVLATVQTAGPGWGRRRRRRGRRRGRRRAAAVLSTSWWRRCGWSGWSGCRPRRRPRRRRCSSSRT